MRSNDIIGWIHLSLPFVICAAVTPDTVIELFASNNSDLSVPTLSTLASKALFGPHLHFGKPSSYNDASIPLPIRLPPDDNQLLCDAPSSDATTSFSGTILLIPKGGCTYQRKVYHAQLLGAKHAIIHATLADKYRSPMQTFMSEKATTYPTQDVDYYCENGRSYIPETEIKFIPSPMIQRMMIYLPVLWRIIIYAHYTIIWNNRPKRHDLKIFASHKDVFSQAEKYLIRINWFFLENHVALGIYMPSWATMRVMLRWT